jgi:putative endonuclease
LLLAIAPGLLLRLRPRSAKTRGEAGERLAERHLRRLGHEVLARNWRHPAAELDLVSQTATHLVVTEVKTTTGQQRSLRRRFGSYARERQRIAAKALAQRFRKEARLDLMEVHMDPKTARISLTHSLDL